MDILDDLRDPRTTLGKIAFSLSVLLLLLTLAVLAISSLVLYRVLFPERIGAGLDPKSLIAQPEVVSFAVRGGKTVEGWFFPGLRTAPAILLCHAYRSERGDLLTLVSPLQENHYNVFVFDFPGHGAHAGGSSLGPQEAKTVLAAIEELSRRNDLDPTRFGIWGADLGGYAALSAAAADPRIKAVAVDSVYNDPQDFLRLQVEHTGLSSVPLVGLLTRWGYTLLNFSTRNEPPLSQVVPSLNQAAKLFIQGREQPALAETTLQLFLAAPEPRIQAVLPRSQYTSLQDEEKREYERQVLNFFLQNLPTARLAGN